MERRDECGKKFDEHSAFDGVYFAVRYLQQDAAEVLCLIAEDAHGNFIGAWPQPEKSLGELN
jgi:hypothetical protein